MGIFEHFPYTNFHNLNLDRILERTKAAEEAVNTALSELEAAQADMAAADAKATLALNTANGAAGTAAAAVVTANGAAAGVAALAYSAVSESDLIDTANTYHVTINSCQACKIAGLILFDIVFALEAGYNYGNIAFKSDYKPVEGQLSAALYKFNSGDNYYDEFSQVMRYASVSGYSFQDLATGTYKLTGCVAIAPAV